MIVIRSFNRLVDLRKRDLFVRRHRNIHFLILSLPILLMKFLKEMLKIVFYFQFILIILNFEMILKESMIVKTSRISIAKNQRFLTLAFKTVKNFSQLDCFCNKTTAFQYSEHGVSCIYCCEEGHPVFNS